MGKLYSILKHKAVIDKESVDFALFLGGRNIGKSYQVKHEVLRQCYNNDTEFIYLRREDKDIKTDLVAGYFADVDVRELTGGEWQSISVYHGKIFLVAEDEDGRPTDKKQIGYAHALSMRTHYKSVLFPKVRDIIFEEFIPDGSPYLMREPEALQEYVSTIARLERVHVWIIGNMISKLSPYYSEWRLDGVPKMRPGQIDLYHNTVTVQDVDGVHENTVTISVEYCAASGILSKMSFGSAASQIVKNEFRSQDVPRLTREYIDNCADECYTMYMIYQSLKFKMILYRDNVGYFWYVRPADGGLKVEDLAGKRLITDIIDADPYHTRLEPISQKEARVFAILREGRIFYANNMAGTDFRQCIRALQSRVR